MNGFVRFRGVAGVAVYYAVLYTLSVLVCSRLLTDWGRWYLQNPWLSAQADAFLHGRLALSHTPRDLDFDLAWAECGVHQVWGLGIPLWQLPFELMGRIFGHKGFPEILAFGVAVGLTGWFVIRTWLRNQSLSSLSDRVRLLDSLPNIRVILTLLLFPGFIVVLKSRFAIWEVPIAYLYLYALWLISMLIAFSRKPRTLTYLLICGAAGFGPLIRPTVLAYGMATVVVASVLLWKSVPGAAGTNWSWKRFFPSVLLGGCAFAVGIGFLLVTNAVRFGAPLEFGHKLNVQGFYGSVYATRFDYPFRNEKLLDAGMELAGALFMPNEPNTTDFFRQRVVQWQSPTVRFREFYYQPFDCVIAGLVLVGWIAGLFALLLRLRNREADGSDANRVLDEAAMMAIWSLLSAICLVAFYLRAPWITSRYMSDFAPSFACAVAVAWRAWPLQKVRHRVAQWMLQLGLLLLLGLWLSVSLTKRQPFNGPVVLFGRDFSDAPPKKAEVVPPPRWGYTAGEDFKVYNIPFNGTGWNGKSGAASPVVTLFVNNPQCLDLQIEPFNPLSVEAPPVQAIIGLEKLKLVNRSRIDSMWHLRFEKPRATKYQRGIQPAFIAFGPKERLADMQTPWRLVKASWVIDSPTAHRLGDRTWEAGVSNDPSTNQ